MLVLSRKVGEEVLIADQVRVKIASVQGHRVRLAISAPEDVSILRAEIQRQRNELAPDVEHYIVIGE